MVVCITSRRLCPGDFLSRMEEIAAARPHAVILREKDLAEPDYTALARRCLEICRRCGTTLIPHSHPETAAALELPALHLPFPAFEQNRSALGGVSAVGVSVHSVGEAQRAQAEGASYLTAGHIYPTRCKPDTAPRGTGFLHSVCRSVDLPVFAIGGITPERVGEVMRAGAAGICIMSELMQCRDPGGRIHTYKRLCGESGK